MSKHHWEFFFTATARRLRIAKISRNRGNRFAARQLGVVMPGCGHRGKLVESTSAPSPRTARFHADLRTPQVIGRGALAFGRCMTASNQCCRKKKT
jgi:hypothetical protein